METQFIAPVPMVRQNQGTTLPPRKQTADIPLPKPAPQKPVEVKVAQTDYQREAAIRQAIERANLFVLSDQRFTIYKDISGQYITRFTSLRDGRVTYIPEPNVLSWLNQAGNSAEPMIRLDA